MWYKRVLDFILVVAIFSGCHKSQNVIVSEVVFRENKFEYMDSEQPVPKLQNLLSNIFYIKLRNESDQTLRIYLNSDSIKYYGIGCQAIISSNLVDNMPSYSCTKINNGKTVYFGSVKSSYVIFEDNEIYRKLIHFNKLKEILLYPKKETVFKFTFKKRDLPKLPILLEDDKKMGIDKKSKLVFDEIWAIKIKPHFYFIYTNLDLPQKINIEYKSTNRSISLDEKYIVK